MGRERKAEIRREVTNGLPCCFLLFYIPSTRTHGMGWGRRLFPRRNAVRYGHDDGGTNINLVTDTDVVTVTTDRLPSIPRYHDTTVRNTVRHGPTWATDGFVEQKMTTVAVLA